MNSASSSCGLTITALEDSDIAEVIALWQRCGSTRPWNDPGRDIALARKEANATVLLGRKDGALVARTFDSSTFAVGSDTFTVVNRIGANAGGMNGHYDVADSGVLAYFRNGTEPKAVLRWFDRSGRPLEALNEPTGYYTFRIAPDDVHVAVDLSSDHVVGRDVWVLNPGGAAPTRITFGGTDDWQPFWSPDGQKVAFMSYRNGVSDIFVILPAPMVMIRSPG